MKIFFKKNILIESYHSDSQSNKVNLDEIDAISDTIEANTNKEITIPTDVINSFKLKKTLNPDIWTDFNIQPNVRNKLYLIAKDFFNELKLPNNVHIKDIIFTGSLANFNWSKFSDIDLHVVLDFKQFDGTPDMIKDYFDAKKNLWNQEHDITIADFPVEIYAQNSNEKLTATAIYSILNNKWILKPNQETFKIDKKAVITKANDFIAQLKSIRTDYNDEDFKSVINKSKKLKDKIKQFRKAGLESGGEFSLENIVFKTLRRTPFFDQLDSFKAKAYDNDMSIDESLNEIEKPSDDEITKYFFSNQGFFDINNAKPVAHKYLKRNIIKSVGAGGNGAAYLTDKGTKIKFTYNENEFDFAKRSLGKKNKCMADYYSAIEIIDGIYVIEMEYIQSLPHKTRTELIKLFNDLLNKKPDYNKELKDKVDNIKTKIGLYANDLFNADNYGIKNGELATFDPVSETKINEEKLTKNGTLLILGNKLEDGSRRLYISYVKYTANYNRNKVNTTDAGKPVNMVNINPNTTIYRIKIEDGKIKLAGVDFKDNAAKELSLGIKTNNVGLNNEKTPLHWESLKYNDVAKTVFNLKSQIANIQNVRWVG